MIYCYMLIQTVLSLMLVIAIVISDKQIKSLDIELELLKEDMKEIRGAIYK